MVIGRKKEIKGKYGTLVKDGNSHYHVDRPHCGDTVNIYKISNGYWGWSFGKGMTRGTRRTLSEVAELFI